MLRSLLGSGAVLLLLLVGCGESGPSCVEVAARGFDLLMAESSEADRVALGPMRSTLIAEGEGQCRLADHPADVRRCMVDARSIAAFRACAGAP